MRNQSALQSALKSRLDTLRIRNPRYSMRSFAKRAGVSAGTMSMIIQGKRSVSQKLAEELSDRLNFDPQERSEVLAPTLELQSEQNSSARESYVQISLDQYRVISDWQSFAILSLIKTVDFQSDDQWIADRLGLEIGDVKSAIERLMRLGMLELSHGRYARTTSKYRTTEDIANSSLRKSHSQTLDLAHASLERDSVEERDFTWITLPMDPEKMILAKSMIRKFQDDLSDSLGISSLPTEVYRLAIQFFPLTKLAKGSK